MDLYLRLVAGFLLHERHQLLFTVSHAVLLRLQLHVQVLLGRHQGGVLLLS